MYYHIFSSTYNIRGVMSAYKPCSIRLDTLVLYEVYALFMLFVIIYAYWCPARFPYQMMFVSFNSNTTGFACGAGTASPAGAPVFTAGF